MLGLPLPSCCSLKELDVAEFEVALREDALCAAHASYSSRYCSKARENLNMMNSEFRHYWKHLRGT